LVAEVTQHLEAQAAGEHPDLVVADLDTEQAAATLAELEEMGLIVSHGRVEELAEQKAKERLATLKQEHGIIA
jgi:hypothetical protein